MLLAFRTLSEDVTKLWFGLGIGNVARSFSDRFEGEYTERYDHMMPHVTTVSFLVWETGVVGLLLVIVGCFLVFQDARACSRADTVEGAFALGWAAVVAVYVVSLAYRNLITPTVFGYLFWYFSGWVAAMRLRSQDLEPAVHETGARLQ
jgi:hypothetical protein